MKLSKKALILAVVVGVSSAALAAPCNVRFQNTLIPKWPHAVLKIGVPEGQVLHQSGVGTTVTTVDPGALGTSVTFTYQVGAGSTVDPVGGVIAVGEAPLSVTRTAKVWVAPNCALSFGSPQPLLNVPTVGDVTVSVAPNNTVSFAPLIVK